MPKFDGKGPAGCGPMTGRGRGFCVLKTSEDNPQEIKGFTGIAGEPVDENIESLTQSEKEVTNMPRGNGTGAIGQGPGRGRGMGRGKGLGKGRMGGPLAVGPSWTCLCPECGYKKPHVTGQPCNMSCCPKCGTQMTRI